MSEDTAHVSCWVNWGSEEDAFFERLRLCQAEVRRASRAYKPGAEEETDESEYFDVEKFYVPEGEEPLVLPTHSVEGDGDGYFEFGGESWVMKPHGRGGNNKPYYDFGMEAGGVKIFCRRGQTESIPNMWIEIGSIPLCQMNGLGGMWEMLLGMLAKEKIHLLQNKLSRVDMYVDIDYCHVGEFARRFDEDWKIGHARDTVFHYTDGQSAQYKRGKVCTGFDAGKGLKLRVYDKRLEMGRDQVKWNFFAQKYDGIPDPLTRIEFQLRRTAIKQFRVSPGAPIDTVEDYLRERGALWNYLTREWFRITDGKVDSRNKNQSRAKTWDIWERIQNAAPASTGALKRFTGLVAPDCSTLSNMVLGGALAILAIEEKEAKPEDKKKKELTRENFVDRVTEIYDAAGEARVREMAARHRKKMRRRVAFDA